MRVYQVGGSVRDKLLGHPSKDLDYVVEANSYEDMLAHVYTLGKVVQEMPKFYTIRALVKGTVADYVLARKEGDYRDGRRPSSVSPGTLLDDLSRRDFTMNAMALDANGDIIDPFGGQEDLKNRLIRCVGNAHERLSEDALRILRALRFSITKDMYLHADIREALRDASLIEKLKDVSVDRVREELQKAFAKDTLRTLQVLGEDYPLIADACFAGSPLWLMPTSKGRPT